jgi:hypothetical protein
VVRDDRSLDAFRHVLQEELQHPLYLTPEEVAGGWSALFPALAASLPAPFPIFSRDEERVVTWGYPILLSDGALKLRRDLESLVRVETQVRLRPQAIDEELKRTLAEARDRYLKSVSTTLENVFMNDYHRGLVDLFLLFHSQEVIRIITQLQFRTEDGRQTAGADHRFAIAAVVADLLRRASLAAVNRLRELTQVQVTPALTPLLSIMCQDHLMLVEPRPPRELAQLGSYLNVRYRQSAEALASANRHVLERLAELVARQPEVGSLLRLAVGSSLKLDRPESLLEPRLLDAVRNAALAEQLHLSALQMDLLRDLALRLKTFELLSALRRRIVPMQRQGGTLALTGASSATPIARTTRPYDFTAPGVVDSAVRRFGLIYDLSNFTTVLEEMRKEGRMAEERALQFMYVFQNRLEAIRLRRRLTFEKFLGDGAFYTSRRALRVIAAACEIQHVYEQLRVIGFPFNHGIRMALNFGVYRLLPMLHPGIEAKRFEFFGHGIVELARLTTGKSAREVSDIAEFLVHAGYDPAEVDAFLAPLSSIRGGAEAGATRRYTATIDAHGELVNEGIVVALPFLEELALELELDRLAVVEADGVRWLLFPIDAGLPDTLYVGLRYLGVARLKGLPHQELAEAAVWDALPQAVESLPFERSLIAPLRSLAQAEAGQGSGPARAAKPSVGETVLVVTYVLEDGSRKWVFGEYRPADDILLHAIQVPISTPELRAGEPLEMWLFRNRSELAQVYDGLRRETPGIATPLSNFRSRPGCLACYLAAPHRALG